MPSGVVHLNQALADWEKQIIEAALKECRGRVSGPNGAAARLGIRRSTLESRIHNLRIDKHYFKSRVWASDTVQFVRNGSDSFTSTRNVV